MSKSIYKRTKHGQLPGDLPKHVKIAMRERKTPIIIEYSDDHIHCIGVKAAEKYRKEIARRGNRRFRHAPIEEDNY